MEAPTNPHALVGKRVAIQWASMAWSGTVAEATPGHIVVTGGRYGNERRDYGWAGITTLRVMDNSDTIPEPEWFTFQWTWKEDDPEAPVGKSLQSFFKEDGQVWRASKVEVTLYANGEEPQFDVEGFQLTKAGKRNRTHTYALAMLLDDTLRLEYIVRAFKLLHPSIAERIKNRLHA